MIESLQPVRMLMTAPWENNEAGTEAGFPADLAMQLRRGSFGTFVAPEDEAAWAAQLAEAVANKAEIAAGRELTDMLGAQERSTEEAKEFREHVEMLGARIKRERCKLRRTQLQGSLSDAEARVALCNPQLEQIAESVARARKVHEEASEAHSAAQDEAAKLRALATWGSEEDRQRAAQLAEKERGDKPKVSTRKRR